MVRQEVEMWQMRNEELETRLVNEGRKTWSLKQVCLEQQKQLKRQTVERQALVSELGSYRKITEENILLCKQQYYDVYATLVSSHGYEKIHSKMLQTQEIAFEADADRDKLVR